MINSKLQWTEKVKEEHQAQDYGFSYIATPHALFIRFGCTSYVQEYQGLVANKNFAQSHHDAICKAVQDGIIYARNLIEGTSK